MKIDSGRFNLYSEEYSELINMWLEGRINHQVEIDESFLNILKQLELESFRKIDSLKKGCIEFQISNALARSSGYAATIIEDRLESTIEDHLEVQRRNSEEICQDTYKQLLFQFKMLSLECFISGIVAGKFNILPFEKNIIATANAIEVCKQNNRTRTTKANELSKIWQAKADEIRNEWINAGLERKLKIKSVLISQVIKELNLKQKFPKLKEASLQKKVRRHIFPQK